MATREKVAAVAIDEPQMAENAAHEPMVAAARAPRMPEKSALAAANSSEDICAREATAPMKMKSGTTVNQYATPGLAPVSS